MKCPICSGTITLPAFCCPGCGTELEKLPKKQEKTEHCPVSGCKGIVKRRGNGTGTCTRCKADFEKEDTAYSGNRPDRNVENKEAFENRQKQYRRDRNAPTGKRSIFDML